ncbi:glycosyltransferase family 2 protein [Planktotalea sp.]|uniref:glycosyltransferase family 2 protein n=1 Tax=Planktotalea sp. TaxID=2029877 RepID=UPI003D6AD9D9
MNAPSVSVIVVSRGRAADLPLCLIGITQLDYPTFEVVLVADKDGLEAARSLSFYDDLKVVQFDEANISKARNLGIEIAAGEIIAFIDDDAVPEPSWLTYLVEGFSEADVAASGGFVIGRNGISFQWKARTVNCLGVASALGVDESNTNLLSPQNGQAIKTEGTNMALRRDVIAKMGGFDPAFKFFLDETDVNYRLMGQGFRTAISPLAIVHHGYKASATRRRDRAPTDLFEIAASSVIFLRKHAPVDRHASAMASFREEQRRRVLGHMVRGAIEPSEVKRLLRSFDEGAKEGAIRSIQPLPEIFEAQKGLKSWRSVFSGTHFVASGRPSARESLLAEAASAVKSGRRASLFIFSSGARAHSVRFTRQGVWVQSGGLFGRSVRSGRRISIVSRARRLSLELSRLAKLRDF